MSDTLSSPEVALPGFAAAQAPRTGKQRSADRRRGILVAAVVVLVGVGTISLASALSTNQIGSSFGPRWWPTVLGALIVAGGIAVAVVALLRPEAPADEPATGHGVLRLATVVALIVAYGFAWYYLHFVVVTAVLLCAMIFVTGGRGVKALVVFPIVTTGILYVLFGMLLRVPL